MAKSSKFFAAELERQSKLAQNNEAEKANASPTPAEAPSATPSVTNTAPVEKEEATVAKISPSESTPVADNSERVQPDIVSDAAENKEIPDVTSLTAVPVQQPAPRKNKAKAPKVKTPSIGRIGASQSNGPKKQTAFHLEEAVLLKLRLAAAFMQYNGTRVSISAIAENAIVDKLENAYQCSCGCAFSVSGDKESTEKAAFCPVCGEKNISHIKYF